MSILLLYRICIALTVCAALCKIKGNKTFAVQLQTGGSEGPACGNLQSKN